MKATYELYIEHDSKHSEFEEYDNFREALEQFHAARNDGRAMTFDDTERYAPHPYRNEYAIRNAVILSKRQGDTEKEVRYWSSTMMYRTDVFDKRRNKPTLSNEKRHLNN